MRVLMLSPTFDPDRGGAESLAEDLTEICVARGHDVTVLTASGAPTTAAEMRGGARVLRVRYPPSHRPPFARPALLLEGMRTQRWHRRLLAGVDAVCVVRVDESCRYVLALKRRLGFRLSVFLHGGEIRSLQREWRRYRDVLRWALREADVVVAVSEELQREATAFEPSVAATTTWIPNGVDVATIAAAPAARRARPFVLFAGRLELVKNPSFALAAFARAAKEMDLDPTIDLVFAGVGSEQAALADAVARSGLGDRVHLLGALTRPEVHGLMRSAACLVVPSLAEGHPLVVLEAWAAGLPVLASDVKGLRTLVDAPSQFPLDDGGTLARLLVATTRAGARDGRHVPDVGAYDLRVLADRHLAAILGTR